MKVNWMGGQQSSRAAKFSSPPPEVESTSEVRSSNSDWDVVQFSPLSQWLEKAAAESDFNDRINTSARTEQRVQPWTTGGRNIVARMRTSCPLSDEDDALRQRDDEQEEHNEEDEDYEGAELNPFGDGHEMTERPDGTCSQLEEAAEMAEAAEPAEEDEEEMLEIQLEFDVIDIIEDKRSTRIALPKKYRIESVAFTEVVVLDECTGVLQVGMNQNKMDFYLLHLDSGAERLQPLTSVRCMTVSYLCQAALSPDHSTVLLAPNTLYLHAYSIDDAPHSILMLRCTPHGCTAKTLLAEIHPDVTFTFDPRYAWSRAVFSRLDTDEDRPAFLTVYDVESQLPVSVTQLPMAMRERSILRMAFTPDGNLLILLTKVDFLDKSDLHLSNVYVYSTPLHASPSLAHTISHLDLNLMGVTPTPAAIFPQFSGCGTYMALGVGRLSMRSIDIHPWLQNKVCGVTVYQLPSPSRLRELCRSRIRRRVRLHQLHQLLVPPEILDFLHFRPFLT